MDPVHDIKPYEKSMDIVNTIIEIPKDSMQKYEIDKETGLLMFDRMLYSSVHYPGDYGFVPQTHCDDNDPLDILVITTRPVYPLTRAQVRVIGVLHLIDDGEDDAKLIGVYDCDPRFEEFKDINDVPDHIIKEIDHFFKTYKELQGKETQVLKIADKVDALKVIQDSIALYKEKFPK